MARPSDHDRYKDDRVDREFAHIEAQLKEATEEVARLRAEAMKKDTYSEAASRSRQPACSTRARDSPVPHCNSQASAATHLQLGHEKAELQQSCLLDISMYDAPEPPHSNIDFPGLRSTEHMAQNGIIPARPAETAHKPSYANMATHGMMNAIGQNFPFQTGPGNVPSTSDGSAYAHTACSCAASHTSTNVTTEAELGDDSVIVSPRSDDHERSDYDPTPIMKNSSTAKASPRFAQPTMAFSRRADETIRKDSVTGAGKTGSTAKPTSIRSPVQKQQKRKALPGDWVGQSPEPPSVNAHMDKETQSTEHEDTCQVHREPALRKKTSTYMSPTKAATQRAIAMTGQESALPSASRLPRNFAKLNLNTAVTSCGPASQTTSPSSPETAIEVENVAFRKLQVHSRPNENPKVAIPRRLTVAGALPHSRRLPANTSISDLLAAQAKAAGLPMPANTTTQRRGSHGHLLIPIKAKLDKIGVLKDNPLPAYLRLGESSELLSPISQNSEPELFSPLTRTMHAVQAALPETPRTQTPAETSAAATASTKKVVPPHVRAAMRDATAAAEAARLKKSAAAFTPSLRATAMEFTPKVQHSQPVRQPPQMTNLAIAQSLPEARQLGLMQPQHQLPPGMSIAQPQPQALLNSLLSPQSQALNSLFSPPPQVLDSALSLQALPMQQYGSATGAEPLPTVTDQDAMKFYDEEEWSALTNWDRKRICDRREILRAQGRLFKSSSFSQTAVPSCPDIFHGKPIPVQAGHVLIPNIDPITKVINWTLQSGDSDNKIPISFGRGTAPPIGPQSTTDQAHIPSNLMAPRTPTPAYAPRSWTIGSEQAKQVYGWKGGDGREIKFVGHGPDAERERNNGVRFNYQRRATDMGRGPRMIGDDFEGRSPEVPLAPRGRRQWAQLAGPPKPCHVMDIVGATEQIPGLLGPDLHGFCNSCTSSH